jgi:murein L,D-transpeptidase YafK
MKTIIFSVTILIFSSFMIYSDFLSEQKKYERVNAAIEEKSIYINELLKSKGLSKTNLNILIIAYKNDEILEIHAKKKTELKYKKLISYKICSSSGVLGPKRKSGDNQVPEGFYFIDRFNPASNFYLSLGINYPNESDKIKSTASNLGGDIFIHGSCVTIGCLPMTDDKIKEIYLMAVYSKNNGQNKIPVYVFPFKMNDINYQKTSKEYEDEKPLIKFWDNLKLGFDKFEKDHNELKISVNKKGFYVF